MMRRMIGISTFAADIAGARIVRLVPEYSSTINAGARRATRTRTLDGGAVVYDAGYAVADQTLSLKLKSSDPTLPAWVAYLVKTYNLIRVTTEAGAYQCVPASYVERDGVVTLEALVLEQLA